MNIEVLFNNSLDDIVTIELMPSTTINMLHGKLKLKSPLDRETSPEHNMTFQVCDGGYNSK